MIDTLFTGYKNIKWACFVKSKKANRIIKKIGEHGMAIFLVTATLYFLYGVIVFRRIDFTEHNILELGACNESTSAYKIGTSLFVSKGIKHFFSNLVATLLLTKILYQIYNKSLVIGVFLVSGILTNIISIYLYPNIYIYGFSSCVYSLLGMLFFDKVIIYFIEKKYKRGFELEPILYLLLVIVSLLSITDNETINLIGHYIGFSLGYVFSGFIYILKKGGN